MRQDTANQYNVSCNVHNADMVISPDLSCSGSHQITMSVTPHRTNLWLIYDAGCGRDGQKYVRRHWLVPVQYSKLSKMVETATCNSIHSYLSNSWAASDTEVMNRIRIAHIHPESVPVEGKVTDGRAVHAAATRWHEAVLLSTWSQYDAFGPQRRQNLQPRSVLRHCGCIQVQSHRPQRHQDTSNLRGTNVSSLGRSLQHRDVNFVFFQKSILVLKKSIFFRLSNLCVVRCRLPLYSEVDLTSWCQRRSQQSVNTAYQLSLWSCRRADGWQRCADCGLEYFRSADRLWISIVDEKLRMQILILYGRWVKFYNWVFFLVFFVTQNVVLHFHYEIF